MAGTFSTYLIHLEALEKNLVNIAPAPLLARLKGFNDWVISSMEMLGRMLIL
jgi:hypothetical protein